MTEVPEHLLARSKAARAKATGGGGGDAGEAPATPGEAPGTGAAASAVEPADAPAAAPAPVAEPPKPVPPYVAAALSRPRIPRFAIPVLASLPVWAIVYVGSLGAGGGPTDPELAMGASVYTSVCAACHGADGGGGTGRPLGDVVATFPDRADHIAWVEDGSPEAGTPYGDPEQGRISQQGWPAMPGFAGNLSDEEIAAVVRYEREEFGGEEAPAEGEGEGEEATADDGEVQSGTGDGEGSGTDEAETSGGDTSGGTPDDSPDAGVEGDEGSGSGGPETGG